MDPDVMIPIGISTLALLATVSGVLLTGAKQSAERRASEAKQAAAIAVRDRRLDEIEAWQRKHEQTSHDTLEAMRIGMEQMRHDIAEIKGIMSEHLRSHNGGVR